MNDLAFYALAALTIISAILALEAREVVYGAISLAISFLGIAGLFVLLDAPFVALFQVIVYVGAIAVLIIFTVMLVRREVQARIVEKPNILGIGIGLAITVGLGFVFIQSVASTILPPASTSITLFQIGKALTVTYWLPLIVLGLILGGSVVAALTLAKLDSPIPEKVERREVKAT
jgi:NADH:ubiquinone oxidoreductase subunit 6 (subunit J)